MDAEVVAWAPRLKLDTLWLWYVLPRKYNAVLFNVISIVMNIFSMWKFLSGEQSWDPGWVREFLEASEGVLEDLRGAVEVKVCQYRDKMPPRTPQERTSLRIAKRMEAARLTAEHFSRAVPRGRRSGWKWFWFFWAHVNLLTLSARQFASVVNFIKLLTLPAYRAVNSANWLTC